MSIGVRYEQHQLRQPSDLGFGVLALFLATTTQDTKALEEIPMGKEMWL